MRQTLTIDSDKRMKIVAAKQLQQWLDEGEIIEQELWAKRKLVAGDQILIVPKIEGGGGVRT